MPVPARTLRAILLGLAVLLVAVVLGFIGYAHRRAQSFLAGLPGRLGLHIDKETDNVTISQSYRGKTIFTVHAARQIQHENGTYTLRDASILLYGRGETGRPGTTSKPADASRVDHIHGAEFELDQATGTLRAVGDVFLDLDASSPAAQAAAAHAPGSPAAPADADLVHIKTSGLVYQQKTRIATTDQFVEFHRAGISGTSMGATYASEGGVIILDSHVHVTGMRNGRPAELNAAHAEFDQSSNLLKLVDAHYRATASNGPETLSADHALIRMTEDNEPRRVETEGHVALTAEGRGNAQAQNMTVDLNEHSEPTLAVLTGGVHFAGSDPTRDERGSAAAARLKFDTAGQPAHISLNGGAELSETLPAAERNLRAADVELAFSPIAGGPHTAAAKSGNERTALTGAEAFGPDGATLRLVDRARPATAPATQPGTQLPAQPASKTNPPTTAAITATEVHAARLTGRFAPAPAGVALLPTGSHSGTTQLTALDGAGSTSIEQLALSATGVTLSRDRSTGDTLHLDFAPAASAASNTSGKAAPGQPSGSRFQLTGAEQHGNVALFREALARKPGQSSQVLHATSADALFDQPADRLTLTGGVVLNDPTSELFADTFTLDHANTDRANSTSEATGNVRISYLQPPAPAQPAAPNAPPPEPIHVLAARATASQATGVTQFFAAPGARVRMWQAGSQVEAPRLDLNRTTRTLLASSLGPGPEVRTILTGTQTRLSPAMPEPGPPHVSPSRRGTPNGIQSPPSSREPTPGTARPGTAPATPSGPVRILSRDMTYLDAARQIDFRGSVRMDSTSGSTTAQEARVFLTPASTKSANPQTAGPLGGGLLGGGQIDHIIATGQIVLEQPGRKATGERLVYTSADQLFVLTGTPGTPPRLSDESRGTVTGTLLRFHTGDDSVEVESTQGNRVHTETKTK